jgi:hypothetical protein
MAVPLINTLEWVILELNQKICPIILIFGVISNVLNLIIFTRETFIKQSCSLYFLCISLNNLAMYLIGLTTRIIDDGFKLNLSYNKTSAYCKIRNYLVYTLFAVSSWLLVLASLDRLYATNQSTLRRQFYCSFRIAFRLIFLTIGICVIAHIHMLIFYGFFLTSNAYNQLTLSCTINVLAYDIFYAFFILIFYSLLPPILMSIIGILTVRNFRQSRRQINSITMISLSRTMKTRRDTNQIIKVLSLQIILLIIFTIPHSLYWLYIAFTSSSSILKTNLTREYEKFFLTIARILLYINYGSSFYIQMIISKKFRDEFIKFLWKIIKKIRKRN